MSTEQLLRLAIAACTNSMQLPIIINPDAKEEAFVYHEPFHTGESIDARGFAQSNFLQSLVFFYEHLPDETFEVFWQSLDETTKIEIINKVNKIRHSN